MTLISLFMAATLYSEMFADHESIATVKSLIVAPGLFILIPCLMAVGGSGFRLARERGGRWVAVKKKRMPFIAMNGLLVLIPCAIVLNTWAGQGRFDGAFYALQSVELLAGAVNLGLMSLNLRDGLKLAGRLRTPVAAPSR
ncbi:hypothetical protein [Saccharospirillum salsuginis]|nr:hypothetical protein [Saccharospirillum salsuginis]